ncbi:hypothetical protein CPB85DRAFT_1253372, partial [Mucidula mucida]
MSSRSGVDIQFSITMQDVNLPVVCENPGQCKGSKQYPAGTKLTYRHIRGAGQSYRFCKLCIRHYDGKDTTVVRDQNTKQYRPLNPPQHSLAAPDTELIRRNNNAAHKPDHGICVAAMPPPSHSTSTSSHLSTPLPSIALSSQQWSPPPPLSSYSPSSAPNIYLAGQQRPPPGYLKGTVNGYLRGRDASTPHPALGGAGLVSHSPHSHSALSSFTHGLENILSSIPNNYEDVHRCYDMTSRLAQEHAHHGFRSLTGNVKITLSTYQEGKSKPVLLGTCYTTISNVYVHIDGKALKLLAVWPAFWFTMTFSNPSWIEDLEILDNKGVVINDSMLEPIAAYFYKTDCSKKTLLGSVGQFSPPK